MRRSALSDIKCEAQAEHFISDKYRRFKWLNI